MNAAGTRPRPKTLLLAALVVAAGAMVRLYRLDHFSYWLDEILQVRFVRGSWPDFWKALRFDAVHPPLDYLVVRMLEGLQPADWVRKLPAVVWGVGTVAAFGALLARRAGRTAGVLSMLLLAFAPFHVRYSQELRPYSLGLFLLCVSLLCLDRFLARPGVLRLAALYAASLACAYSLYLAALVLGIAGAALVLEDSFSPEEDRRRAARRFLGWSPLYLAALWLGYLPWWPVLLEAARRPAPIVAQPLSLARLDRIVSFFAFASEDGERLGRKGPLLVALFAAGTILAMRKTGLRFLAVWAMGGLAAIEVLWQIHPHFDATRRYLPAGIALTGLACVALAGLWQERRMRIAAPALLALVLLLDSFGLVAYFRHGRPDWRPLAAFLRHASPPEERIFSENQYTQLCLGYYLRGGSSRGPGRQVLNLDGEVRRLTYSWIPGTWAWLVLAGGPEKPELRRSTEVFPSFSFPSAEGGAILRRLDPALRAEVLERPR